MRGWRAVNRGRESTQQRERRQRDGEQIRARERELYALNKEKIRARKNAWDKANPEKKRAARDPYKSRHYVAKRKALMRGARAEPVNFVEILIRDRGLCGICHQPIMETTIELDHVVPLAAGGWHAPDNVQLAHRSCNRRKFTRADFTLVVESA